MEEDTVTLNEEKGEIACVDGGHDVEQIPSILENPRHCEIDRRNIRDKLRMDMACESPLPRTRWAEIEESTFDVIDHGMVPTSRRTSVTN